MSKRNVKEHSYKIIKDETVKHAEILEALSNYFDIEIVGDDPKEDVSWANPTLIVRQNGMKKAVKRAQENKPDTPPF